MTVVHAFPSHGDVFFDVRDDGRNLRLNWHPDEGIVVLSTWRHGRCIATCHLLRNDVPDLIGQLVDGLAVLPSQPWTEPTYINFSHGRGRSGLASRLRAALVWRRPTEAE